jgi:hypothetical protein
MENLYDREDYFYIFQGKKMNANDILKKENYNLVKVWKLKKGGAYGESFNLNSKY